MINLEKIIAVLREEAEHQNNLVGDGCNDGDDLIYYS